MRVNHSTFRPKMSLRVGSKGETNCLLSLTVARLLCTQQLYDIKWQLRPTIIQGFLRAASLFSSSSMFELQEKDDG